MCLCPRPPFLLKVGQQHQFPLDTSHAWEKTQVIHFQRREVGAEGVPWPGHGKPLAPELPALVDSAHHPQLVPGAELDFLNLILN